MESCAWLVPDLAAGIEFEFDKGLDLFERLRLRLPASGRWCSCAFGAWPVSGLIRSG
jgi:hypothetical protein